MHKEIRENPEGYGQPLDKGTGRILQITKNEKGWEVATRSPGTRMMFVRDTENGPEMLLTREFRQSINDYDYRLPGGKVVDTFEEYLAIGSDQEKMRAKIEEAVRRESLQEAGIDPEKMELYQSTRPDATVQWNLYYYLIKHFQEVGQEANEEEEEDIRPHWMPLEKVLELCMSNHIQENRSRAVIYDFILNEYPEVAIKCLIK